MSMAATLNILIQVRFLACMRASLPSAMMLLLAQRSGVANPLRRQSHHALDNTESARMKRFPASGQNCCHRVHAGERTGEIAFACGMQMLLGTVVVGW